MKRSLFVLAVIAAGAILYFWLSRDESRTPSANITVSGTAPREAGAGKAERAYARDTDDAPENYETKNTPILPKETLADIAEDLRREERFERDPQQHAPAPMPERDPTAEVAPPAIDGGRPIYAPNAAGIKDAVRARVPELKECYESWLAMSPELKGKTTFSFAIVSNGQLDAGISDDENLASVVEVKLQSSSVGHAFMEGCIARVFEDLRFRPPEGGRLAVTYPLMFDNALDAGIR